MSFSTIRVCATSGNLEFLIPGNLLEFNWSFWKFFSDGTTTKESSHKNLSPVLWKVVMMIMYISYEGYIYMVNRITDLRD